MKWLKCGRCFYPNAVYIENTKSQNKWPTFTALASLSIRCPENKLIGSHCWKSYILWNIANSMPLYGHYVFKISKCIEYFELYWSLWDYISVILLIQSNFNVSISFDSVFTCNWNSYRVTNGRPFTDRDINCQT